MTHVLFLKKTTNNIIVGILIMSDFCESWLMTLLFDENNTDRVEPDLGDPVADLISPRLIRHRTGSGEAAYQFI